MIDPSMPLGLYILTLLGTFIAIKPDVPMRLVLRLPKPLKAALLLSYRISDIEPLSPLGLFFLRLLGFVMLVGAAWLVVVITRVSSTPCAR